MIRIIADTTFGYWNGKSVEPKTKDSAPFSVTPEREAALVELGIAEYVDEAAAEGEVDDDGNFVVDGDVIGHVDGEDIVITDQDVINETLKDANNQPETKVVDDVEVTVEMLEGMKLETLKEFAEPYGVEYKVGMKKADFAQLVFDAIEVEDEAATEEEDDVETPPPFNPEDAVV